VFIQECYIKCYRVLPGLVGGEGSMEGVTVAGVSLAVECRGDFR
jgi:hypothetical protein